MAKIGTVELIAKIDTSNYKKGASEIDKANSDIENSSDKSSKKFATAWSDGAKIATAAIVAATAIMVKSFVDSASEIQSLRASFESLTGNIDDTNDVMNTLYKLGLKTAFNNKDIQAAGRNYLAAGVAVKDLGNILSYTADIAGATGANLAQLTLPLTQTIARGKLQTQDFYQILNSGAGALRKPLTELAGKKGFGSLADAMEKGAITADDLVLVMQEVTQEGGFAFRGAIKQSETFNGRMSNLQEAITNVGLSMLGVSAITGEIDPSGPFAKLSDAVETATDWLSENGDAVKDIATVIGILLTPAIIMLGVQGLIAGARLGAGILLALGPIGLIIAAVVAATYLIISNWESISKFIGEVWGNISNWAVDTWNKIVDVFKGLPTFFYNIWNGIIGIFRSVGTAIGNAIGGAFKSVINGVISYVEWEINNVVGIINAIASGIDAVLPGDQSGWRVPTVQFPRLAEGGIVSSPTLAMIGEGSEPEAVIPLSKLDGILANENSGSSSSNNTFNINLSGIMASSASDEREIAKRLVERINEELRAKGKPQII